MTGTRDPQQDGSIPAMLRDSGLEASTGLRGSLEQLRALVPEQAPAPRADLAALLASGAHRSPVAGSPTAVTTAMPAVVSLADRRSRKRRLAIVGGAVVGAMSLGAGAVAAANEDFRHQVSQTVGILFQPAAKVPAPEHGQPSPSDIPAVPAAPTAGASTAAASPVTGTPGSPGVASPKPSGPADESSAASRDRKLPTPGQRQEAPGLPAIPGLPGLGEGDNDEARSGHSAPPPVTSTVAAVPTKFPGQP